MVQTQAHSSNGWPIVIVVPAAITPALRLEVALLRLWSRYSLEPPAHTLCEDATA